jgi:phage tail protein X
MTTYTTVSGDMWDAISYKVYGSTDYTGKLMAYNSRYLDNYIFPAGIVLEVPEITMQDETLDMLPPWRRPK